MNTHTSASEIQRNAAAVRARLWGKPKVVNVLHEVLAEKKQREMNEAADLEAMSKEASAARKIEVMERRAGLWLTEEQHEIAVKMYDAGKTYLEISAATGKTFEAITYHIQRHRDDFVPRRKKDAGYTPNKGALPDRVAAITAAVVLKYDGVGISDVIDKNKGKEVSAARREVFYRLKEAGYKVSDIARYFRRNSRNVAKSISFFGGAHERI